MQIAIQVNLFLVSMTNQSLELISCASTSSFIISYIYISLGTGKSVTGAHLAYTFAKLNERLRHGAKGKCVVYCGPSNKAVDVVHGQFRTVFNCPFCEKFM